MKKLIVLGLGGLLALPVLALFGLITILSSTTTTRVATCQTTPSSAAASQLAKDAIPVNLLPIYRAAEKKYKVQWYILAGINKVETDFGRNLSVSYAGAVGWMQFMPATWAAYGVDANGDGRRDPNDPEDAIFGAANYLHANGAPKNLHRAIFAYNHAEWYVTMVMGWANKFVRNPQTVVTASADQLSEACGTVNPNSPNVPALPINGMVRDPGDGPQNNQGDHLRPRARNLQRLVFSSWGCKSHHQPCIREIGGWRPFDAFRDHPGGYALDIVISSGIGRIPSNSQKGFGWGIACFLRKYAASLGVEYTIWDGQIWWHTRNSEGGPGKCAGGPPHGWRLYGGGSGVTQGHYDHIHVTVLGLPR